MQTVRPASALLAALLAVLGSNQAHAQAKSVEYQCPASDKLTVHRNGAGARVTFAGRTYQLQRRRSSIGAKYISPTAALIIDGPSAVFVAQDQLNLGTCIRPMRLAAGP